MGEPVRPPDNDLDPLGSVKVRLLATALDVIAEDGLLALSLRKVARRTGVSHNAPYMHFADKEALLGAIAEDGFRRLGDALTAAKGDTASGSIERLHRLGLAYVAFARAHPQHFEVMFAGTHTRTAVSPEVARVTFEVLVDAILAGQAAGAVQAGPAREIALAFWSLVHGFARLEGAGRITATLLGGAGQPDPDAAIVERLIRGVAAPPGQPTTHAEGHATSDVSVPKGGPA